MRNLAAAFLILGSFLPVPCVAGTEPDISQILQGLGPQNPKDTIAIDYQVDTYISTYRPPKEEIDGRMEEIAKSFPRTVPGYPDAPGRAAALNQLADYYTTGNERGADLTTRSSTLILSPDFAASRLCDSKKLKTFFGR